jgi:corrinoid protein of di/trimethylamine methyltransferase
VVKNVQELPFDLFFNPDDIGFGAAPMISPKHFKEFCVPVMKNVFDEMSLPVVYHSDGNIMPVMDDIISLGVAGVANMEPGPMDINEVKKKYGSKITIVGNIDLHYTLTDGTPEETKEEVRERIFSLAPGGRYILASANSLPNYVKPENVRAMGEALLEFGDYQKGGFVQTLAEDVSEQETSDESETDTSEVTISADVTESKMSAIKEAIITQQQGKIADLVQEAVDAGIAAEEIINDVMISAMDEVGRKFTASEIFVPEMLLSANTMKEGVNLLQPLLQGDAVQSRGKIMIATVKGDLHDIGKNIVSLMLEGGGFEVVDLGINIDEEEILRQVKKHKPDVLALSALLTTTMNEMRTVIQSLHEAGLKDDTPVMVGGAPVSQEFADQIGADGYSQDAAGAVELAKSFTAIQQ